MSLVGRKPAFAYAKTKTQISFAVTAKLIGAFVFATRIVQSLYFLNTKFQASSHLLWLYSPVCVGPGQKPRRPVFSERGSYGKHTAAVTCNRVSSSFLKVEVSYVYRNKYCLHAHNVKRANTYNNYYKQHIKPQQNYRLRTVRYTLQGA